MQDKIINELEDNYVAQRNKGNVSSMREVTHFDDFLPQTGFDEEDDLLQPNMNHRRGITGLGNLAREDSEVSEDSNEGPNVDVLETVTDALGNTVISL
jgi:hypothetical protein